MKDVIAWVLAVTIYAILIAVIVAENVTRSTAELEPAIAAAMTSGADRQAQSLIAELDRMTAELQRINEQLRAMNEEFAQ